MKVIVIDEKDNVGTTVQMLYPGEVVKIITDSKQYKLEVKRTIPQGHKIAVREIQTNKPVIKYGEIIGLATADIKIGEHVHVHNVKSSRVSRKDELA